MSALSKVLKNSILLSSCPKGENKANEKERDGSSDMSYSGNDLIKYLHLNLVQKLH